MIAAGVSQDAVRRLLSVNRLDQRRAGMVAACYLRDTGKEFPYLQNKRSEFRNNVIHNASWPTREETLGFAEYVCRSVLGVHRDLGPKMSALLSLKDEQADLAAAEDIIGGREAPTTVFARPSLLLEVDAATNFENGLASFARKNWWKWRPLRTLSSQE